MKLTFLGHSTFLAETEGKRLLFDPFLTSNPLNQGFDISSLRPDYILLSHGHGDHSEDILKIYEHGNPMLIANHEITTYYQKLGIKNVHSMNIGGKHEFDFGALKMVNAIHSSSFPDGTYAGNPAGFLVWNPHINFYFAGDTALTRDMKLIGEYWPHLDFAILPMGDNFTMGYTDAAIVADFVKADKIVGCHFNTFPPITIDTDKAVAHFASKGKTLMLLNINQTITITK